MSIEEHADMSPYLLWKLDQEMGPRPLCMQKMIDEEEEAYQRSVQGCSTATAPTALDRPKPETGSEARTRISQKNEDKKVRAAKATANKMVKSKQMKKISSHFPKVIKK
jgi:hypothetical protein